MIGRVLQMVRKEFIQVLRDKRLRFFIVVPPIVAVGAGLIVTVTELPGLALEQPLASEIFVRV